MSRTANKICFQLYYKQGQMRYQVKINQILWCLSSCQKLAIWQYSSFYAKPKDLLQLIIVDVWGPPEVRQIRVQLVRVFEHQLLGETMFSLLVQPAHTSGDTAFTTLVIATKVSFQRKERVLLCKITTYPKTKPCIP